MKQHTLIVFCYFLLAANPVSADTKSIMIDVGGLKFDIKAPVAFHEISSLSPETLQLAETMTPPTNRLLAFFVSEEDLGRIMKSICKKANVKYFRFHALRHAGASLMDNAGVNTGDIQRILGHENRSTTEIYLHSIGDSERTAMDMFEQANQGFEKKSHTKSHTKAQ